MHEPERNRKPSGTLDNSQPILGNNRGAMAFCTFVQDDLRPPDVEALGSRVSSRVELSVGM